MGAKWNATVEGSPMDNKGAFEKVDAFNFPETMSLYRSGVLGAATRRAKRRPLQSLSARKATRLHAQNGDKMTTGIWRLVFAW